MYDYLGTTVICRFREESLRGKLEDIEADFEAFLDELVAILFEVNVLENKRYVINDFNGTVSQFFLFNSKLVLSGINL
jgi:hypothetical protein